VLSEGRDLVQKEIADKLEKEHFDQIDMDVDFS
jgi:hypothetical protein